MIRCYIVEDEKPALIQLQNRVESHPYLVLCGQSSHARKAISEIDRLAPDLIFLDVELPDLSGIDIIRMLTVEPFIIFTTAYDRYAVDAFNSNAVDFLLKPYSVLRFNEAVQRVKSRIHQHRDLKQELSALLTEWRPNMEYLRRIPSRIGDKIYILNSENIVYFCSRDKVVLAKDETDDFIINFTLDELQKRLDPNRFIRIHRSTIINFDFLKTIEPLIGGTYQVTMNDKKRSQLPVSRAAGKMIRSRLNW